MFWTLRVLNELLLHVVRYTGVSTAQNVSSSTTI